MNIKLFNTMSRKVETFKPIKQGEISIYTCGPTVYHFAHIGNLRTYVSQDIMKRMFLANGYKVLHIMNITDVGHLTSDADDGEDKMEKGSLREGKSVWDIASFYTNQFLMDVKDLNILPPTKYTPATSYIKEQIELVQKLESLGFTYEIKDDGIYYDTSKFKDYGKLGGQSLDELKGGARVAFSSGKRNITDFALWKFSPKNQKRQMEWDSPWGVGFPGWHIECSAMCLKEIGDRLDIHSGGVDHIKIHHTNEIAQVEPVINHNWVNYWVHMEFLNDLSGKMSKSKGDFLTLSLLKDKGYSPIVYRYFLLLANYRTQLNFSFELLDGAKKSYENIIKKVVDIIMNANDAFDDDVYLSWKNRILEAVSDDLNTPLAIVILQELLKSNVNFSIKFKLIEFFDDVLGLQFIENANALLNIEVPENIKNLAELRWQAKLDKDYQKADLLKKEIIDAGFNVEDKKDSYEIKKL